MQLIDIVRANKCVKGYLLNILFARGAHGLRELDRCIAYSRSKFGFMKERSNYHTTSEIELAEENLKTLLMFKDYSSRQR